MKLIKKVFIPFKIRSLNYFMYAPLKLVKTKENKIFPCNWKYINYYKRCEKNMRIYLYPKKEPPSEKRYINIIFYKKKKLYDKQNFIAGCKPVLDILKKLNYIKDDSEKWIEVSYTQILIPQTCKKKEGFLLEIYSYQWED